MCEHWNGTTYFFSCQHTTWVRFCSFCSSKVQKEISSRRNWISFHTLTLLWCEWLLHNHHSIKTKSISSKRSISFDAIDAKKKENNNCSIKLQHNKVFLLLPSCSAIKEDQKNHFLLEIFFASFNTFIPLKYSQVLKSSAEPVPQY